MCLCKLQYVVSVQVYVVYACRIRHALCRMRRRKEGEEEEEEAEEEGLFKANAVN